MDRKFDDRIEKIIMSHNLDCYFPNYQRYVQAEKVLVDFLGSMKNGFVIIAENKEDRLAILPLLVGACEHKVILTKNVDASLLMNEDVIIVSRSIENISNKITGARTIHNIYSVLEDNGIIPENEWYRLGGLYSDKEFYNLYSAENMPRNQFFVQRYFLLKDYSNGYYQGDKEKNFKAIVFMNLIMKDFVALQDFFLENEDYIKGSSDLLTIKNEIINLLDDFKKAIQQRNSRDILIYWMDALNYSNLKEMPYVSQKGSHSQEFTSFFTNTPFTNPVFRAIFAQISQVDDKGVFGKGMKRADYGIIDLIERNGYKFGISGYLNYAISSFEMGVPYYCERYSASSEVLWATYNYMISDDTPKVLLSHCICETHFPFWTNAINTENCDDMPALFAAGVKELDRQIDFYHSMQSDEYRRIYMSDHGTDGLTSGLDRFHVILNIYDKQQLPSVCDNLVSTLDLGKIIVNMVTNKSILEGIDEHEYIRIQDVDYYSDTNIIQQAERMFFEIDGFGYTGTITKDMVYLRYACGIEWLQYRDHILKNPTVLQCDEDIADKEKLPYYREIAGEYPAELKNHEFFALCREKLYKRFDKFNCCIKILNEQFANTDSRIAFWGGGKYAYYVYRLLSVSNKKKVVCFVDKNPNCVCSEYGLPIVCGSDLINSNVNVIALSTLNYGQEMRAEIVDTGIHIRIVDIADVLEKAGISPSQVYYRIQ